MFKSFELSPELLKSLGLDTLEKRYRDAIPTIFDRGSPKAKCQVKGKQTFSKTKTKGKVKAKFRARLSPGISPKLSPSDPGLELKGKNVDSITRF